MRVGPSVWVAALGAVVCLALLVAGCGGGGATTVIEKTITETTPSGGDEAGSGVGGADEADGEGAEAAAAGAEAEAEAAGKPVRVLALKTFRSPTGNIGCVMYGGGARCDIRRRDWKPPPHPARCPQEVDFGQGLTVSRGGSAAFVCAGDTALDPSAPPLPYGSASELGGTECGSQASGITCTNGAGHGFFISVQSYRIF